MKVQCTICGKTLDERRNFLGISTGPYPAWHVNESKNVCHGFFVVACHIGALAPSDGTHAQD
jgi:hypothetical protein